MQNCLSSGSQTASAAIKAAAGLFFGILVATDGANAVTLDVYDNDAAAAGTKLIPQVVIPSSATDRLRKIFLPAPVIAHEGIWVEVAVAGGGTCAYVGYFK